MDKNFGGVIWTNHALSRMRERGIKQGDAWVAWRRPDQSEHAKIKGSWIYYRTFPDADGAGGRERIEVVAKPPARGASGPEGKKWIILSVWSRPVMKSFKKQKSEVSFLGKLVKRLLGL